MKVLIVGGGGREHAIALKIKENPEVTALYAAPGNGGIAQIATCLPFKATDVDGIVRWAAENKVDFVIVAPDDPLCLGMVDALAEQGIPAFGPRKNAAIIENTLLPSIIAAFVRVRPAHECRDYRGQQSVLEEPDEEVRHSDGGV